MTSENEWNMVQVPVFIMSYVVVSFPFENGRSRVRTVQLAGAAEEGESRSCVPSSPDSSADSSGHSQLLLACKVV